MSIRATDLDKLSDLIALLDDWRTAAENIGLELRSVNVMPQGGYSAAEIGYQDDGYNPAYWTING